MKGWCNNDKISTCEVIIYENNGNYREFNPFHNGHKYLIEKAKKITGAKNAIIVCSGNYVQRGMPAFYDKSLRTKAALRNGQMLF